MACPVNHPFFHALVFLLGVIVVLSRYVKSAELPSSSAHILTLPAVAAHGGNAARSLVGGSVAWN
ncbi:hypothetical protein FA10DRAFT_264402 [Acaromyces ingoldii]|uniref:Secreted protein n=1 Tax=Acaromyces ingoldii TaxID=215250 RepID=A0A316YYG5_9BASI|nr:hypothetical protein FA10DRAFT_264402 [Acaromyces ingoldii]PWN93804.1 hypothetical protein FA10DRAFT_264402 [Acaromyces ingoldii]